ncbi:MAG: gluconate 2-dehydrogenase subunit 3 family protein [Chitinivibrionales bacterium]|nr:gluconate 2-dehydrogenase subunit 3 family protein [Chitinivibrionales bacterium]
MNRRSMLSSFMACLLLYLLVPRSKVTALYNRLTSQHPLADHEMRTAVAIADCIWPGARNEDIENFFRVQGAEEYYAPFFSALQTVVSAADTESRNRGFQDFLHAKPATQDEIIHSFCTSESLQTVSVHLFNQVNRVIDGVIEGCFSDPLHGGNKKRQTWQLFGNSLKSEWFDV